MTRRTHVFEPSSRAGAAPGEGPAGILDEAAQLLLANRARRAERVLRKLLKAEPNNPEALHLAGVARHRAGQAGKACELIEQAIRADPSVATYYVTLGGIFDEMGDLPAAIDRYAAAVALDPLDSETGFALANALRRAGRLDEAIRCYEDTRRINPDNVAALFNMGNALRDAGRLEDAVETYLQVVESAPHYVPVYINVGNVLVRLGRVGEAFELYQEGAQRKFAPIEMDEDNLQRPVLTSTAKLQHDAEQIDYLIGRGVIAESYAAQADVYRRLIDAAPPDRPLTQSYALPMPERRAVATTYNRMFHLEEAPRLAGPAVNPGLDSATIEREYNAGNPEIVFFDDFLTPEALQRLRDFCLNSAIWFTHYDGGYVGAFLGDGFASPILAQIVEELPKALPGIFGDHRLRQAWAFKYDSRLSGINMHADFAAVNVNFWITPDDAVEEEGTGGLIVWDKEAPLDWDFEKFNNDQTEMRRFLDENDAGAVRVPYRQNRALVFNSDLFHETDRIAFKPGYENRRINITLLYGDRGKS